MKVVIIVSRSRMSRVAKVQKGLMCPILLLDISSEYSLKDE